MKKPISPDVIRNLAYLYKWGVKLQGTHPTAQRCRIAVIGLPLTSRDHKFLMRQKVTVAKNGQIWTLPMEEVPE